MGKWRTQAGYPTAAKARGRPHSIWPKEQAGPLSNPALVKQRRRKPRVHKGKERAHADAHLDLVKVVIVKRAFPGEPFGIQGAGGGPGSVKLLLDCVAEAAATQLQGLGGRGAHGGGVPRRGADGARRVLCLSKVLQSTQKYAIRTEALVQTARVGALVLCLQHAFDELVSTGGVPAWRA